MRVSTKRTELTETLYLYYKPMVEKAAGIAHRSAFYIARDDFEQNLWCWLIEYGHDYFTKRNERNLERGEEPLSDTHKEAILARRARSIATRELMDYREFNGDYLYQYEEVKDLLFDAFGEGSEDTEARVDIREAFEALERSHPKTSEAVLRYYIHRSDNNPSTRVIAVRGMRLLCHYMNNGIVRKEVKVEDL